MTADTGSAIFTSSSESLSEESSSIFAGSALSSLSSESESSESLSADFFAAVGLTSSESSSEPDSESEESEWEATCFDTGTIFAGDALVIETCSSESSELSSESDSAGATFFGAVILTFFLA